MSTYNHPDLPDALMNQPLPRIISRGETFRAAIGERVILPCQVKDLGEYVHYRYVDKLDILNNKEPFA